MKYSFKCPGCGHVISVEAENDDEAIGKLNAQGAIHAKEIHPEMPPMSDEDMTNMVRAGMQKEEVSA